MTANGALPPFTRTGAKDRSPPIPAVRHSRVEGSFGVRRRQSFAYSGRSLTRIPSDLSKSEGAGGETDFDAGLRRPEEADAVPMLFSGHG